MKEFAALLKSFTYAFKGIGEAVVSERNMRVHIICAIYMYSFLGLTDWFVLSRTQWAILFLANSAVFMGELINTAAESIVDMVTKEYHPLAKKAKDAAAGAVLVGAIFAVAVGVALLWQPDAFRQMYEYFISHILMLLVFVLSLVIAVAFILFGFGKRDKEK